MASSSQFEADNQSELSTTRNQVATDAFPSIYYWLMENHPFEYEFFWGFFANVYVSPVEMLTCGMYAYPGELDMCLSASVLGF